MKTQDTYHRWMTTLKNFVGVIVIACISFLMVSPIMADELADRYLDQSIELKPRASLENGPMPNGQFFFMYDTDSDGLPDLIVYHTVKANFQSMQHPRDVFIEYHNEYIVVSIPFAGGFHHYVIMPNPVLIAVDTNHDGKVDTLFKDPLEDGINGNEEYSNPIGNLVRFTAVL